MNAAAAQGKQPVLTRKGAWALVGLLAVGLFLNNCDRHAVFAIFPVLRSQLHFSDTQLGLTGSMFLWVYALCNPFAGQIGDRFSKRKLVTLSLLLWSVVMALTGLATSVWMLLAFRGLLGVTESLYMPNAMALLAEAHGPKSRSLASNLYGIGEYAGVAMSGWYASLVAQEFHWRLVFLSLGLLGILYTIPFGAFVTSKAVETRAEPARSGPQLSAAVLARIPTYRFLCVVFPVCVSVVWLAYTWLPTFLYEKFALTLAQAGFTATVYLQTANLVGSLTGAALADRLYSYTRASRYWVACAGFFIAAPSLHLMGSSGSLFFTKMAAVGFGLGAGLFLANLMVSAFEVVPVYTRASACGCMNLVGSGTSGFASVLEGRWKESIGLQNMMSFGALACVGAGLLLILCIRFYFPKDYARARG